MWRRVRIRLTAPASSIAILAIFALTALGHELETTARRLVDDMDISLQRLADTARGERGELPFIAFHKSSSIRQLTDAGFREAGHYVEPSYECRALTTAGGLLGAGLGVSALPELALRQLAIEPHEMIAVVVAPLQKPSLGRQLGILTAARRRLSPAATAFLRCLNEQPLVRDADRVG